MIDEHVPVAVCAGDLNADQVAEIKRAGITVVFRPLTPTVEITKQAEAAGVDIFVATALMRVELCQQRSLVPFQLSQ